MEPDNTVAPRGSAEITIPYTWVEGEAYGIGMITSTGVTFEAEVPLAVVTPGFSADTFWRYALIGFYVGVVPVRSEEHTSELQSRQYLVCRLLLEKKKKNKLTAKY